MRHQSEWTLIGGPFRTSAEPIKHAISVFCPDFYDIENASYLTGTRAQTLTTSELQFLCQEYLERESTGTTHSPLENANWQEPLESEYQIAFSGVKKRIQADEIRKAVPVAFARAELQLSAVERVRMLQSLTQAPATLYIYGFWDRGCGILGATPETLFVHEHDEIRTMALAGTCPKTDSEERTNLMQDPKERAEHDFVVEDILEQLAEYGNPETKGPYLLELPTLWHLKTDISVSALVGHPIRYGDLIRRLHPTPALGVFPRKAGFKWMQEFPGQKNRARFGAPFAFVMQEKAICLVAIRNLQWNDKEVLIGSGGGVVAASELEREFRELFQKRLSVKKILGMYV